MEIADIFVVNKADREGADRRVAAIESNLSLAISSPGSPGAGNIDWQPPILKTIATNGTGGSELVETIGRFRSQAEQAQANRRQQRSEFRLREIVAQQFMDRLERGMLKPGELAAMVERVAARELDPYTAADQLLALGLTRAEGL